MLGNKIKKIRELQNLKQEFVAQKLNMTQQNYSKLENNQGTISNERLNKIANIFNMKSEDIENFDEKVIFANNTFSFSENSTNISYNQQYLDEIKQNYEKHINDLHKEIDYLKDLVKTLLAKTS
jgi:transcriptional regulator with XRE-family HTH domain